MKLVVALLLVSVALVAATRQVEDDRRQFEDYMQTYGRRYTGAEKERRFECFRHNLNLIEERNALHADQNGVNQFTDICPSEFAKYYLGYRPRNATKKPVPALFSEHQLIKAGQSVDWRTKGAVTPVKNQGMCGSCWSFSATGNMEGQWQRAGHPLTSLSEEELVQCSHNGNQGCNGGLMDYAFEWVIKNGGIDSETGYPYTSGSGITGFCKTARLKQSVAKFSSYADIPHSETQMATWVCTNGPLAIGVDASSWQTYNGGIMKDCSGRQLDHGVLIVGFSDASTPYWIIKNSWGVSWGENGYIRVAKGSDQCGITMSPCTSKV